MGFPIKKMVIFPSKNDLYMVITHAIYGKITTMLIEWVT